MKIVGDRPVFRRIETGNPHILRSEVDFSLANEADLRAHIAGRRSVTINDIRKALADITRASHTGVHGTQVEYASNDGKVYLWYPGNSVILQGEWKPHQIFVEYFSEGKLLKRFEYSQVCFRYGANTYNPATGQVGDGWECQAFDAYRKHLGEGKRGDVLKLKGRIEPPFILSNEETTLDALRARTRS